MTTGIGIVGVGMVGQMCHLANFVANPACRVIAVADLRPELAAAAAAKFNVPRIYQSHYEMLDDDDIDAIVVVTRRRATGPIVLDALNSGRHVLSEKPMAYTVEQATKLVDAARQHNLTYSIGYMKRHDAGVAHAAVHVEQLRSVSALGPIVAARGWCFGGNTGGAIDNFVMTAEARPDGLALWSDGPGWMPTAMRPGYDVFLNVHSHIINLARHLLGPAPALVTSTRVTSMVAAVTLDFDGIHCTFELANNSSGAWREGLAIVFERGTLTIDLPPPFMAGAEARITIDSAGQTNEVQRGHSWSFSRQADAFVADITQATRPLASGEDSAADIALAEAIWRSHVDG